MIIITKSVSQNLQEALPILEMMVSYLNLKDGLPRPLLLRLMGRYEEEEEEEGRGRSLFFAEAESKSKEEKTGFFLRFIKMRENGKFDEEKND